MTNYKSDKILFPDIFLCVGGAAHYYVTDKGELVAADAGRPEHETGYRVKQIAYGAGGMDLPIPNVLRLMWVKWRGLPIATAG